MNISSQWFTVERRGRKKEKKKKKIEVPDRTHGKCFWLLKPNMTSVYFLTYTNFPEKKKKKGI